MADEDDRGLTVVLGGVSFVGARSSLKCIDLHLLIVPGCRAIGPQRSPIFDLRFLFQTIDFGIRGR
jgi:hypothetical protein